MGGILPPLSGRLRMIAEKAKEGGVVADIGTDHALVPVWLTLSGRYERGYAGDVKHGPLERARTTIERYGAGGLVVPMLSDGLDAFSDMAVDTFVVAGMGGELLCRLLDRAGFLRDTRPLIVLQSMTDLPEVRMFLSDRGFDLVDEELVRDSGKLYSVMTAGVGDGGATPLSRADALIGRHLLNRGGELFSEYLRGLILKTEKRAKGLLMGRNPELARPHEEDLAMLRSFVGDRRE